MTRGSGKSPIDLGTNSKMRPLLRSFIVWQYEQQEPTSRMGTDSPSEEGATHRLLVPKGSVAAKLAEIYTVPLHSSYTAKKLHAICNENNVMQKFYHPFQDDSAYFDRNFRDRTLE